MSRKKVILLSENDLIIIHWHDCILDNTEYPYKKWKLNFFKQNKQYKLKKDKR